MDAAAGPADIITTRDLALGRNWYALESYAGQRFRWVENDAELYAAVLTPVQHVLRLVVEPAAAATRGRFALTARTAAGDELGTYELTGKQTVEVELPAEYPAAVSVVLHVERPGKTGPNDARVLNFRVFGATIEYALDVFPAWAKPKDNFYPLERYAGKAFRWVSNDARIALHRQTGDDLTFLAEAGPGLDSKPFTLEVRAAQGQTLAKVPVGSRSLVRVPLAAAGDASELVLHVEGGGKTVRTDPRILNFRVFSADG